MKLHNKDIGAVHKVENKTLWTVICCTDGYS